MPCALFRSEEQLKSAALDEIADVEEALGQPIKAQWYRMKAANLRRAGNDYLVGSNGVGFACGSGVKPCRCGFAADWLCDAPIGDGKTCDIPICSRCRLNVGPELDLCPLHIALAART